MRLAAIYNVFDGTELLRGSINCIKNDVDKIIIVYQNTSNFGEKKEGIIDEICKVASQAYYFYSLVKSRFHFVEFTPFGHLGQPNEIKKRQLGINAAKKLGCTHFIQMDCDEYYEDFGKAKQLYIDSGAKGSVCKMWTYFKEPTLRFERPEGYFVPFIHELRPDTTTGQSKYPFYCDRTRQVNEENVVELPVMMHHFSWVRRDIKLKLRNSSAKGSRNIEEWASDYNNTDVKEGFYVKDFQMKLVKVDNIFNIQI